MGQGTADARGRQVSGRDRRASEGPRHPVRPSQGASGKGLLAVVFIYLHTYLLSTTTTTTLGPGGALLLYMRGCCWTEPSTRRISGSQINSLVGDKSDP